ncbi:MAG: hypothetical protein PHW14_06145, partial [Candidatus Omnitrophica bacterium]|nr:hypothetical protein [Candidatus Omnitrophota bacterium]
MNNIVIKTISGTLSLLLCWQSVVWADPGIIDRNDLSPVSMFSMENVNSSFTPVVSRYIVEKLFAIEADRSSRNLYSIKSKVEEMLLGLKNDKNIPAEFASSLPVAAGDPEDGEFILDIGRYRVRYFNPKMPSVPKVISGYVVIRELRLGKYLGRQLLESRQELPRLASGNVAQGDPAELFKVFREGAYVTGDIRPGIKALLPEILEHLKILLENSRLNKDFKRAIRNSLDRMEEASFIEIKPLVLWGEHHLLTPAAWLLGFNTLKVPGADPDDETGGGDTLFGEYYPNTVALTGKVLDIMGDDKDLLGEYIFHEAACPVVGHIKAREIQEELFPENYWVVRSEGYKMVGLEDFDPGRKDGELSLIFRHVMYEEIEGHSSSVHATYSEEYLGFNLTNFREEEKAKATEYYFEVKPHYESAKKLYEFCLARAHRNANHDREHLRGVDRSNYFATTKLVWIWSLERLWARAERILSARGMGNNYTLSKNQIERVKEIALKVIELHMNFMESNPLAQLIKDHPGVKAAEKMLKMIVIRGILPGVYYNDKEEPVPDDFPVVKTEELSDKDLLEGEKEGEILTPKISGVSVRTGGYNWKAVGGMFAVMVASTVLSFFLSAPWIGLSFAIVTLGYLALGKKYGNILRSGMPPSDGVREVKLASAVLRRILKVLAVLKPEERDAKNIGDRNGKRNMRNILTTLFLMGRLRERIRVDRALKNTLRPIVNKELARIENGPDTQLRSQIDKLRKWRENDSLTLAGAFIDVTQEVVSSFTTGYSGDSGQQEMLAAQELISEYFNIPDNLAMELRFRIMLQLMRKKIASDALLQRATARDRFLLGVLEFRLGNDREALFNFRKAAPFGPFTTAELFYTHVDYFLGLGMMEHYMRNFKRAESAYNVALNFRTMDNRYFSNEALNEEDKLKQIFLKFLIRMAEKNKGLDGKKVRSNRPSAVSRGLGAVDMIRGVFFPEMSYGKYAVKIAPKLEEVIFTFVPFVLSAAGVLAGEISLRAMIFVMAASYFVFVGLHMINPSHEGLSSPWESLKAIALKMVVPIKIAAFNFVMASFFGGVAVGLNGQLSVFSLFYSMILAGILSMLTYRFHDKVAQRSGVLVDVSGEIELSELKQKVKDIIPEVPVVEVPYNASMHILLSLRQMKEAWRGRQFRYALVYFFNLVLFMRTPNTQHVISDDGGLRAISIFSGGWTLGAFLAPLSVTSTVVLLFFGSVPFYVFCVATAAAVPFVVDLIMSPFYKGTAESHEWLHAYQFKLIEKARREGKIRDAGDFIEKNMMALETIWMYDHKPLNEGVLKEVRQHVGSLIERGREKTSDKDRPSVIPEDDLMEAVQPGNVRFRDIIVEETIPQDEDADAENTSAEDRYRKTLMRRRIMKSGEYTVPELVNALISSSMKNEKTVLVMDMGLGSGEVNRMLRELVRVFSVIEDNNEELKAFLWNIEVIKGEGASLSRRVTNLSNPEKGSLSPENIVVITTSRNMELYKGMEGRAFIAGIDDRTFPDTAWMPLIEITLFAIGKHLGWSEEKLKEIYDKIPNVVPLEDLSEDD